MPALLRKWQRKLFTFRWGLRTWWATYSREQRIRDFFIDSDRLHVTQRPWFRLVLLLGCLGSLAYLGLLLKPVVTKKEVGDLTQPNNPLALAITFVIGIIVSVSTSLLAVLLVNRGNLLRIEVVRRLANQDILESVFSFLGAFQNKHSEDKHVHLKFDEPLLVGNEVRAAQCTLTIRQRLRPTRRNLILEFERLSRDQDPSVSRSLLDPLVADDLYSIDVTDINHYFPGRINELFPGLVEVSINSDSRVFNGKANEHREVDIVSQQNLAGGSASKAGENKDTCNIDLREDIRHNELVDVEYRYKFALEVPGHTFFEVSEPTRGFHCTIDYSKLKDIMTCFQIETVHASTHSHDVKRHDSGVITISTDEWLLPRSGVAFIWYTKDTQTASQSATAPPVQTPVPLVANLS